MILLITLLSGCIKDDLSDCYTTLYFSYLGDGTQEIFPEKIEKVNLYIYNEGGSLVQSIILDESALKQQQITLNLPNGKYHLVCWGNSFGHTQINDDSSLNTGFVSTPEYSRKDIITTNDSLYYASKDIDFSQDVTRTDTVRFNSAHIKMLIDIAGLEDMRLPDGSSPLSVQMTNLSPTVSFNRVFSNEDVDYFPVSLFDAELHDFEARFDVLRFNDDNDININLTSKETGNVIYSMPLKQFMRDNKITVNNINEAFIGIRFAFNGTAITVKPWDEEEIRPGM